MPSSNDRGIRVVSTDADRLEYQSAARDAAVESFLSQSSSVNSTSETHVRGAIPSDDLDANDETVGTAVVDPSDDVWETEFGSDEDGDFLGWYAIDDRNNADDKGVAIWGFQNLDPDDTLGIEWVRVRNRTGGLIDQYDLSGVDLDDDKTVLIENPLVVGTQSLFFEVYSTEADTFQFKPLVEVAEEAGDTFEDADRFIA